MSKSNRGAILAAVLVAALALLVRPVMAQDYRFNVRENRSDLYINPDGTVQIVYDLTFAPEPGSDPVDVVDVGLPNGSYRVSEIRASIDGRPLTDVSDSPYVEHGVAVELGANAIQPGDTGTVHVEATVRDMLYQDSSDPAYASIEFVPVWFGSDFVRGSTRLEVNFHLPPGVTPEEPRYHDLPFTSAAVQDGRVVYTWIDENARGDAQYRFGASFPQSYLAAGVVQQPPKAPAFNLNPGVLCSSPVCWIALFAAGWVIISVLGSQTVRRRRMEYLPPNVAVEGAGIKRGLTAVEAAILLEAPLEKVLTMILFGLVKKGVITVESAKPLRVTVAQPQPDETKLWYYERRFLTAVREDGTLVEKELREMVIDLIGDVNKKLTGFSRKETRAYYKDIAARAWQQVEAADTPEVLGERWGEGLEWTMLDDHWDDRTKRVFEDRPVVVPTWWWGYRPWVTQAGPSTGPSMPSTPRPSPAGGGTPVTLPTLPGADFANTVVGGIESAANTVVGKIESFTGQVVQETNPPPRPSSSSSRGGGYSCACACACAGCACACAGGGR